MHICCVFLGDLFLQILVLGILIDIFVVRSLDWTGKALSLIIAKKWKYKCLHLCKKGTQNLKAMLSQNYKILGNTKTLFFANMTIYQFCFAFEKRKKIGSSDFQLFLHCAIISVKHESGVKTVLW